MASIFAISAPASAATKHGAKASPSTTKAASKPAPGGCQPTPDQASIGIRALQTDLMVAGLKCSADQWNIFTAKFKRTIKNDADRLQKLFSKTYGAGGASRMNAFVTQLANDASQRSNGFSEAVYCEQQNQLFQKVLALTELELERFSAMRTVAVPAPVALCTPEPEAPTTTAAAGSTPALVTTAAASNSSAPPSVR